MDKLYAKLSKNDLLENDGNNRIMYFPNPVSYQYCVSTIFEDKNSFEKILDKIEKNKFSHSKILADDKLFNIPIKGYRSKYLESMHDKMYALSMYRNPSIRSDEYNYMSNVDTAIRNNCNEILKAVFICYICKINEAGKYDDVIKEYKKMVTETDGINFKIDDWLSKYILYYYDYIDESEFIESDNFYKNFILYKANNIKFIDLDTL